MPPVLAAIGAVVGAIGAIGAAVGTAIGIGAAVGTSIVTSLAISAGLSLVGSLLKPKPPPARGSVTQVVIDPDAAQPYAMGEGLIGGAVRHDVAYGPTLDDVVNPFRFMAVVYSGGGPVAGIEPRVDQQEINIPYYAGFMAWDVQEGHCPESEALYPELYGGYTDVPGWNASSKLSGQAAISWNMRFDREGKKFASGVPQFGAYGQWVKVYDPRKDSTFPGGAGSHVLGDETTYEWSENPALHAGTYAYGRYQNGKRTIGCGLPADAIDWAALAAWANVCDANGWKLFGVVYEPDDRWQNLKDICAAGGATPIPLANGGLSFHYAAPRVSIATITEGDLADPDISVTAMGSWRDRLNTIIPKYVEPDSNWELVSAEPVDVPAYVTEDGEVKRQEWPFNFVKDVNQAAQLATYVLMDGRELQPIEITCHPWTRWLRPGDCVDLDLPSIGLDGPAVILRKKLDPATLAITLTLVGETPEKHAYALGKTTTPPPTPALKQTAEERDLVASTLGGNLIGEIDGTPSTAVSAALNDDGTVKTGKVGTSALTLGSVTTHLTMESGATTVGNGAYQVLVSGSIDLADDGEVFILFSAGQAYAALTAWDVRIKIDGVVVNTRGGSAGFTDVVAVTHAEPLLLGMHTVDIEWRGASANVSIFNDVTYVQGNLR